MKNPVHYCVLMIYLFKCTIDVLYLCVHSSGPPSAPGNPISTVNETAVTLEWSPPRESGGRGDVTYSVHCRKCSGEAGAAGDSEKCVPCGSGPHFNPRQFGLTHPRVLVSQLQPHTNYTFNIEALNGVSDLSPSPRQLVPVNVTTSQTGAMSHIYILCFSIKHLILYY